MNGLYVGVCVRGWAWVWGLLSLDPVEHGHHSLLLPLPGMWLLVYVTGCSGVFIGHFGSG